MAGTIKGITIEFRGDTTRLDKALRQVNNETRSIDAELRKVNNALKFNPGNVDLLRQKQQLLGDKIKQTEEKLKSLKAAQAQMDAAGVDKNSEEYRKLQREIIESESKLKHFNAEARKVAAAASPLGQFSAKMGDLGKSATKAGQSLKGLSMAAAGVAAGLGAMTYKAASAADDLNTMSKVYSVSTKDLQKYALSADLVDVSVETIAKSHTKLEKNMLSASQGSKNQAAAFEALGVAYKNADGSLRDGDAVWQDTIAALGKMENETERDAYAMQLMGKSAAELNPLIEDGGETYKRTAEIFSKYGLDYIDQDTLDQANAFKDELDTIKAVGLLTLMQIGSQLAAYLAPAMQKVVDWAGKLSKWLSTLSPQTLSIVAGIAAFLAVLAPALIMIGRVATGISAIAKVASLLNPVVLGVIAAVAAAIAIGVLLYKNWDTIKAKAVAIWTAIKNFFSATWDAIKSKAVAIWNGIKTAVMTPLNAMRSLIQTAVNSIKNIWNGITSIPGKVASTFRSIKQKMLSPIESAKSTIQGIIDKIKGFFPFNLGKILKLKIPHISVSGGKAPWGIAGKGKLPSFSVNWYKNGGIFDNASIIGVGEAGAEAVVPLKALWAQMDAMAEKIVAGTNGNATVAALAQVGAAIVQAMPDNIVMNLNGRQVATAMWGDLASEAQRQGKTLAVDSNIAKGLVAG